MQQYVFLRLFQVFSIVITAGALCTGYLFARLAGVHMHWTWYWLLPSTVWLIYTADHLLDGIRLKEEALTPRHYLHYYYRKPITIALFFLAGINLLVAIFYMPQLYWKPAGLLSAICALYFLVVHRQLRWSAF